MGEGDQRAEPATGPGTPEVGPHGERLGRAGQEAAVAAAPGGSGGDRRPGHRARAGDASPCRAHRAALRSATKRARADGLDGDGGADAEHRSLDRRDRCDDRELAAERDVHPHDRAEEGPARDEPEPGTVGAQAHRLGTQQHVDVGAGSEDLVSGREGQARPEHVDAASRGRRAWQAVHGPDELRDEDVGRLLVDLRGHAELLEPAGAHDADPVRDRERLLLVVGHEQRRDADLELDAADLVAQLGPHLRVEGRERLVEKQDAGADRQRPCEGDALLLAAGELMGEAVRLGREAHELEQLPGRGCGGGTKPPCGCAARRRRCRAPSCSGRGCRPGRPCRAGACSSGGWSPPRRRSAPTRRRAAPGRRGPAAPSSCRSPTVRAAR